MFDKKKFQMKLFEYGKGVKDAANAIGCNEVTLYRKMNGTSDFTRNEIQLFRQAFHLTVEEVEAIFFAS